MIPTDKDLILQKKVKLYNNLATINDCQGRLLAELEIYPTPRLTWEFEVLGEIQGKFPYGAVWNPGPLDSLVGYSFLIENPVCTEELSRNIGPAEALRGEAKQAVYGELNDSANLFIFYLPNTQFQAKRARQNLIRRSLQDSSNDKEVGSSEEGRYGVASIDKDWEIRLDIRKASLEWLNPRDRNIGTFITTIGQLRQTKSSVSDPETFSNLNEITLHDALERIENLCWLLSYINGGYIGPLYIEGYKAPQDKFNVPQISCAAALSFRTTPLEKIGQSWVTEFSDLNALLSCFSTFEKMMHSSLWRETFDFTLIQYFQAIQPDQVGWPVRASAVGAALERLSHMILIDEETDSQRKHNYELLFNIKKNKEEQNQYSQHWKCLKYQKKNGEYLSQTGIRLSCLLERVGLTQDQDADDIQAFLDVRNDAVHPRVSSMTIGQRSQLIRKAIQWIDEILLWRIGYNGQYLDRSQNQVDSISPRYDLTLRDSSW
jgi:hypothetical protein